jgi:lipid-A-disaccharide synthase
MIVSGEPSGDYYAEKLINELHKTHEKHLTLSGMGGPRSKTAGMHCIADQQAMAVMGLVEVLQNIRTIKKTYQKLRNHMISTQPDLLVLIDYPSFNLKLAKAAKKKGIPVLYYIPPKVWAWKKWRLRALKKYTDHLAVLLPFEYRFFKQAGCDVTQVIHPLIKTTEETKQRQKHPTESQGSDQHRTLALLPGSRRMEWQRMLPIMLKSACLLQQDWPNLKLVLPVSQHEDLAAIQTIVKQHRLSVRCVTQQTQDVLATSDLAMAVSGTITLEAALHKLPMVIIYRIHPLTYWLVKPFIKVKHIGLCNLIADKTIATELIQHQATPTFIAAHLSHILARPKHKKHMQNAMQDIYNQLNPNNANIQSIASLAQKMLEK